jgi:hypothetical protein
VLCPDGHQRHAGTGTKYGDITPTIVGDKLNILAVNAGVPGACAGVHKLPEMNPVSLYSLVDAIVSGDWSQQVRSGEMIRDVAVSRLMMAGFSSVTHLGLEYGTNDFHYGRPIGVDGDCAKETFKGALNYAIRALSLTYPKLHIFLITPSWLLTHDGRDSDDQPNENGAFLREYIDAMNRISELNHIPCLDMWRTLGVNKYNEKTFIADGTHPTDFGAVRRGEVIASFMNSVF